jgi:hypothetical protein
MLISAPSERAKGMLSVIDLHVASTSTPNYQLFTGTASTHAGGGERSPLGVLEDNGTDLLFEHFAEGPANTMRSQSPIIWQVRRLWRMFSQFYQEALKHCEVHR